MDGLTFLGLGLILALLYRAKREKQEVRKVYVQAPPVEVPDPAALRERTFAQAGIHGWAVTITATGIEEFSKNVAYRENEYTPIDVHVGASIILLGELRDSHPDPTVADRSAELILQLGKYARTTTRN